MFAVSFRYQVPADRESSYCELQRRVAELYLAAGCRDYLVMRPRTAGEPWVELAVFASRHDQQRIEAELIEGGALSQLFDEFTRMTGLSEADLRPVEYDVRVQARA